MTPHRPQPKVDAAGDAGQAGLEAVLFGVLVFVLGTMLVVNAWAVVDAKLAATSAAREAARSYVEAPTAQVADADARRAAEEAEALLNLPGWPDLPAVRDGRVWVVDANSFFSRPAPRLVEGVEILARILHPGAFPGQPERDAASRLSSASG